jgi:hypothetical protein
VQSDKKQVPLLATALFAFAFVLRTESNDGVELFDKSLFSLLLFVLCPRQVRGPARSQAKRVCSNHTQMRENSFAFQFPFFLLLPNRFCHLFARRRLFLRHDSSFSPMAVSTVPADLRAHGPARVHRVDRAGASARPMHHHWQTAAFRHRHGRPGGGVHGG